MNPSSTCRSGGSLQPRRPAVGVERAWAGPATILAICALMVGCTPGGGSEARRTVERVVDELVAQRYGTATSLYRERQERLLSPAAAPAWRRALEHQDPTVRQWAVDALGRIGLEEDEPRLVAALEDPFQRVREAASEALIQGWPGRASSAFRERLHHADPEIRIMAAQGLGDLGDNAAIPGLVEGLLDRDAPEGVRQVHAQVLANFDDPSAADALAEVAGSTDEPSGLRRTAAESLSALTGPEAEDALKGLVDADDPYVRDVARRAVGEGETS